MTISEFQAHIEAIYYEKDSRRGLDADFRWFMEEVGELARALRHRDSARLSEEFADVFAWPCTLASISGIKLEQAVQKYAHGCPKCGAAPCRCD